MVLSPWAAAGPDRAPPAARPPASPAVFRNSRRVQGAGCGCSAMVPSSGKLRENCQALYMPAARAVNA